MIEKLEKITLESIKDSMWYPLLGLGIAFKALVTKYHELSSLGSGEGSTVDDKAIVQGMKEHYVFDASETKAYDMNYVHHIKNMIRSPSVLHFICHCGDLVSIGLLSPSLLDHFRATRLDRANAKHKKGKGTNAMLSAVPQ